MDVLLAVWEEEWLRYGIDQIYVGVAFVIVAFSAYRNWAKTLMVSWVLVYLWTMVTLLSSDLDMQEGMNVVWVCGYGLLGFIFLAFCYYMNLRE